MSKILTTCDLVTTAFRRGMLPEDQDTFTSCDVIDIMNEELNIHVVPTVMRVHEEYYVDQEVICLTACICTYKIPARAIGNKLRDVTFIDTNGQHYRLTRKNLEDKDQYQGFFGTGRSSFIPYYLLKDEIVFFQCQDNSSGQLVMTFYLQPNTLVKESRQGKITSIATCGCNTIYTVCSFPTHFSSTCTYDFINASSPNSITIYDICVGSVDSNAKTLTFPTSSIVRINPNTNPSNTQVATISVGDYIMKQNETPVPQLPSELHPLIAQRATIKMHEALGDFQSMERSQIELDRMEKNAYTMIDNRVEGTPQKINNRNSILRSSLLRGDFRGRY